MPAAQCACAVAGGELPIVEDVELSDVLKSFGLFKSGKVDFAVLGENNAAERMMDGARWR